MPSSRPCQPRGTSCGRAQAVGGRQLAAGGCSPFRRQRYHQGRRRGRRAAPGSRKGIEEQLHDHGRAARGLPSSGCKQRPARLRGNQTESTREIAARQVRPAGWRTPCSRQASLLDLCLVHGAQQRRGGFLVKQGKCCELAWRHARHEEKRPGGRSRADSQFGVLALDAPPGTLSRGSALGASVGAERSPAEPRLGTACWRLETNPSRSGSHSRGQSAPCDMGGTASLPAVPAKQLKTLLSVTHCERGRAGLLRPSEAPL